jgi:hypothetical protein
MLFSKQKFLKVNLDRVLQNAVYLHNKNNKAVRRVAHRINAYAGNIFPALIFVLPIVIS